MKEDVNYDEVSLKEIILKIKEYLFAIWNAKLLLSLFALFFAAIFILKNVTTKPTFPASLSFMINDEEQSSSIGVGSILGQFGLGSGGSEYNLDKVLELSKSRKITQNALFNNVIILDKKTYLANHLIEYFESKNEWGNRKWHKALLGPTDVLPLKGFRFSNDSISNFTTLENKALKSLHQKIIGNKAVGVEGILETEYSETSGIMYMTTRAENPELSIHVTKELFSELSEYYVEKTIEKQNHTFKILKEKTDSISGTLASTQYQLASFKDAHQSIFSKKDNLKEQKLMMEIQKLSVMYGEAEKNLQIADLSLKNKTPYIQVIDDPLLPIPPNKQSIILDLIKGLMLGGFLGFIYIIGRKIIKDALTQA